MIEEAVSLFRHQYGIHPAQSAYPVINVYEKQHAYLYASSEEAVKAYKTQQNIIRLVMTYFLWPVAVDTTLLFYAAVRFQKLNHPLIICCIAFYACWGFCFSSSHIRHSKRKRSKRTKSSGSITETPDA